MSHQQRAKAIKKAREFSKTLGGETMPSEAAIDDLLAYIDELEEMLKVSEAESERLLAAMGGTLS